MTSQEKRWGHIYITIWQNFERNQRTFFSIKKPPLFGSWSWIFFWYKKFFADFPNFRTLISPELHLKKNWAKSENNFGTYPSIHPPSVTLRKYRGQKWADTPRKLKSKKHFPGADIKQKEIKLGLHRGPPKDGPPPGDKKVMIYVNFPLCTFQLSCKTEHYTNTMKIFGRTYLKGLS